jgi:hypothetical protein
VLHLDLPSLAELRALVRVRSDLCVSLYLPTTPLTQDAQADRIALKNQLAEALAQARAAQADKRRLEALAEQVGELVDDDEFWAHQAHGLAVLATPDHLWTFRLPSRFEPIVEVSDRLYLKPLYRALTFPHEAFVLALAQGSVRLLELARDLPMREVRVEGLPRDAASAVRRSTLADRSPKGRIQGAEGQKVRLAQYARAVDAAIRPVLAGRDLPLVLAATRPLDDIFRRVCSVPGLAAETIALSPDGGIGDPELATLARGVIDRLRAAEIAQIRELFASRAAQHRATTDLVTVARAVSWGAVDTLLVDIDRHLPGTVDEETGEVELADRPSALSYGVVDEIAGRALLAGGRVLGLRAADMPGGAAVAAILRRPLAG